MKIYELLEKPESWTQGVSARDKNGKYTATSSKDAVCWCLAGAIMRCYGRQFPEEMSTPEAEIAARVGAIDEKIRLFVTRTVAKDYVTWNDEPHRKHQDVLNLVRNLDI